MRRATSLVLVLAGLLAIAGCGSGGDTTTIVKEVQPTTIERTTTVQAPAPQRQTQQVRESAPAPEPEPESEPSEPPNVVGLPLPAADKLLKEAGYSTAAKNTDTTFGIIVRSNYTVCTQGAPRGTLVPVLAQKYGC